MINVGRDSEVVRDVENEWADMVVTGLALLMRGQEAAAPEEVPFHLRIDETEREVRRKIPGNVDGRCGHVPSCRFR